LGLLSLNLFIMQIIKGGTLVQYIGKTNDYTFNKDICENSIGIVKKVFEVEGITSYQVEFENGIMASIKSDDLEKLK